MSTEDPNAEDTSTPTAQWTASQAWWAGDSGNNDPNPVAEGSTDAHQSATTPPPAEVRGGGRGGDATRIFGALPNSSYNPTGGLLADPVERELRRRSAGLRVSIGPPGAAVAPRQPSLRNDSTAVAEQKHESREEAGPRISTAVADVDATFWREECRRLQGELANLAEQRDKWEREKTQYHDKEDDRARELVGLKRAVEAQSQLVMESLVSAQRLAAEGRSTIMAGPGPGGRNHHQPPSASWVQPYSPREISNDFEINSPAVALARRRLEIAAEPHPNLYYRNYDETRCVRPSQGTEVIVRPSVNRRYPGSPEHSRAPEERTSSIRRRASGRDGGLHASGRAGFTPAHTESVRRSRPRQMYGADVIATEAEEPLPPSCERSKRMAAPDLAFKSRTSSTSPPVGSTAITQRRLPPPTEAEMRNWARKYGRDFIGDRYSGAVENDQSFVWRDLHDRNANIYPDSANDWATPTQPGAYYPVVNDGHTSSKLFHHRLRSSYPRAESEWQQQQHERWQDRRSATPVADSRSLYYDCHPAGNNVTSIPRQRQLVAARAPATIVYDDSQRDRGWRRVSVSKARNSDDIVATTGGEVWEWNGRTVVVEPAGRSCASRIDEVPRPSVLDTSATTREHEKQRDFEEELATATATAAAAEATNSLLEEIKQVKAAVQAFGDNIVAKTATLTDGQQQQPKPPESQRPSRSGSSASPGNNSPRRTSSSSVGYRPHESILQISSEPQENETDAPRTTTVKKQHLSKSSPRRQGLTPSLTSVLSSPETIAGDVGDVPLAKRAPSALKIAEEPDAPRETARSRRESSLSTGGADRGSVSGSAEGSPQPERLPSVLGLSGANAPDGTSSVGEHDDGSQEHNEALRPSAVSGQGGSAGVFTSHEDNHVEEDPHQKYNSKVEAKHKHSADGKIAETVAAAAEAEQEGADAAKMGVKVGDSKVLDEAVSDALSVDNRTATSRHSSVEAEAVVVANDGETDEARAVSGGVRVDSFASVEEAGTEGGLETA